MTADMLPIGLGIAVLALIVAIGRLAMVPANRLGIGVFRPYRGDPWPVGVQEDDDARFDWTPRRNRRPVEDDPADPPVEVERLARVGVRRARH
jgi:hypothetical protein